MANEYGIFQSIVEGDQADAYRKKKADKAEKEKRDYNRRLDHRDRDNEAGRQADKDPKIPKTRSRDLIQPADKHSITKRKYQNDYSNAHRVAAAHNNWDNYHKNGKFDSDSYMRDNQTAADAVYRHNRRHPDRKLTHECSIEFI